LTGSASLIIYLINFKFSLVNVVSNSLKLLNAAIIKRYISKYGSYEDHSIIKDINSCRGKTINEKVTIFSEQ